MSATYPISEVAYPWMAGVGFLCGLPVALLRFELGSPKMSIDTIIRDIKALKAGSRPPRWVAIRGLWEAADNDLFVSLRVHCGVQVAIEVDGSKSMWDRTSQRLPMWDHVAVRLTLPAPTLKCELFHSVVARVSGHREMEEFSAQLDKLGYNGPRFVEGPGATACVAGVGGSWRVTRAVEDDVLPGIL